EIAGRGTQSAPKAVQWGEARACRSVRAHDGRFTRCANRERRRQPCSRGHHQPARARVSLRSPWALTRRAPWCDGGLGSYGKPGVELMRSHMRLLPDAATAALYALSLAVACGIVGCMIGQTLGSGALTAVFGLLTGSAVFGGRLWRIYHPRSA